MKSTYTIRFLERSPSQLFKLCNRHFAIVGITIRRPVKLLAFVLLLCGSFKIDISTRTASVEVIVLKISSQTIAL